MSGDARASASSGSITLDLNESSSGSRSCEIIINQGSLGDLGERAAKSVEGRSALVAIDDQLPADRVRTALESLDRAGFEATPAWVRALEVNKTLPTVERLLVEAHEARLERRDLVVAVGGGIVGDIAGFVAASYMRGVRCIQCPTTLLAMVDASVGGKTGVNLIDSDGTMRKNMIGAFWQPSMVLIDSRALHSLPDRELRAGVAECLKHGMLSGDSDPELFAWTSDEIPRILARDLDVIDQLVQRNVQVKAGFVQRDERETADALDAGRALLNLGHTFAHAIEPLPTLTLDDDPAHAPLLHGEAVALGLVAAAELARSLGELSESDAHQVRSAIERLGMRTRIEGLPEGDELLDAMRLDKKTRDGRTRMVIPVPGCRARVVVDPDIEAIRAAIASIRR